MLRTNWLERWALYSPKAIAFKDYNNQKSYSYEEIFQVTNRISQAFLNNFNICYGDRVAILSQNCVEYILIYFALQQIGAILVPLNYRLSAREISFIIHDSSPNLIIYQDEYLPNLRQTNLGNDSIKMLPIKSETHESIQTIIHSSIFSNNLKLPESGFDDVNMILYTSGTTGRPKGALITNKMVFWNSINTTIRLNITSEDVTPTFAPFFHTGGWHVLLTPFIHRGAKQILLNSFNADQILKICDEEKITILFGVPTMMKMMADSQLFSKVSLKSVRFAIVGGEPMPKPLIEIWNDKGVPIRQGYGLTEVGPNCFSLPEQDVVRKIGSIGFPNFYVETKIVNEKGNEVQINQPGELLLKGPMATTGYWNDPKSTSETIEDGWFRTGDIVRKDEEGYYFVVDRKKDMFISGAENVYPAEVESFLYSHPKIAEVSVIGVQDEKWGEVGKAFIVLKNNEFLSEQELADYCKGNLAKYKIPKYFEFIKELPKGHSGKILKRLLKEKYNLEFNK